MHTAVPSSLSTHPKCKGWLKRTLLDAEPRLINPDYFAEGMPQQSNNSLITMTMTITVNLVLGTRR